MNKGKEGYNEYSMRDKQLTGISNHGDMQKIVTAYCLAAKFFKHHN